MRNPSLYQLSGASMVSLNTEGSVSGTTSHLASIQLGRADCVSVIFSSWQVAVGDSAPLVLVDGSV